MKRKKPLHFIDECSNLVDVDWKNMPSPILKSGRMVMFSTGEVKRIPERLFEIIEILDTLLEKP